jgi:hypothetical protein
MHFNNMVISILRWHGGREWGRTSTAVEAHVEEEWVHIMNLNDRRAGGVDLDGGGGRHGIELHAEEEQAPVSEWRGNDSSQI